MMIEKTGESGRAPASRWSLSRTCRGQESAEVVEELKRVAVRCPEKEDAG